MILQRDIVAEGQVLDNIRRSMEGGTRSEGTHVSELIYCLRKATARRRGVGGTLSPSTILLFATGRALQDYMSGTKGDASEVTVDGITGTPDQVFEVSAREHPREFKATYMSAAKDIMESTHYIDQLAAYCHMKGVLSGQLVAWYVNGYYNFQRKTPHPESLPGERSVLRVWSVRFTPEELTEWWEEMRHRKVVLDAVGDLPLEEAIEAIPLAYHHTWECEFCELAGGLCPGGPGQYDKMQRWER